MANIFKMKKQIDFAFLDSGTGGIPYMKELKKKNPDCSCVYLGDTAHFPYGEKSPEEVTSCASTAISLIIEKWHPRTIVVACNTISVTALDRLRSLFPSVPLVGTVPAIKLAAKISRNKRIGLLATNATVNHPYCRKLEKDFASDCQVFKRGDPSLISFIENELWTSSRQEKLDAVKNAVDFFASKNCDTIVLGCTHFCHLADIIQEAAGKDVFVVDSREGVANQALRVEKESEENPALVCPSLQDMTFFVTKADSKQEKEYEELCRNLNIFWGGLV